MKEPDGDESTWSRVEGVSPFARASGFGYYAAFRSLLSYRGVILYESGRREIERRKRGTMLCEIIDKKRRIIRRRERAGGRRKGDRILQLIRSALE